MDKALEKQRQKFDEDLRDLVKNCGFSDADIAMEARINYPRFRRIIHEGAEPTNEERDKIRSALARKVGNVQKKLSGLTAA